eukprot:TRINITY_DN7670_c0_g1_i1.p2 TRINITY_DN7670_c0_g1~~TRINITY_DN7670_c0_g1_i1.p2  ORF type:complete len:100 (-),score=15.91 TRINITY_DN7670_c0_g1_i1:8-307(-)
MAAFMLLQAGDPAYVSVATPGPPPSTLTLRHGSVLAAQAAAESSAASSVSGCHRAAGMLVLRCSSSLPALFPTVPRTNSPFVSPFTRTPICLFRRLCAN